MFNQIKSNNIELTPPCPLRVYENEIFSHTSSLSIIKSIRNINMLLYLCDSPIRRIYNFNNGSESCHDEKRTYVWVN